MTWLKNGNKIFEYINGRSPPFRNFTILGAVIDVRITFIALPFFVVVRVVNSPCWSVVLPFLQTNYIHLGCVLFNVHFPHLAGFLEYGISNKVLRKQTKHVNTIQKHLKDYENFN